MTRPVSSRPPSVKEWRLNLYLSEHDPETTARIVLDTGDNILESRAEAHRSPQDREVPEIGDELAAGRALVAMGHLLMRAAQGDIKAMGVPEEPAPAGLWEPQE
ncbi:hypothetical protein GCM10010503_27760 [Streptomyces lucensis JCM 4490]|uniref:DUF1876 domain-containing protein n=1 Tax=Streptomyces lucensis JCM 4490 TaxID=1306176 RepID=A0A918MRY7_9ACTN|nr:dsRBD fold-containing protein [Streptomyces lucensis]GGW49363.1 hypothetical protein GCM10010503_27760 [Streptomyces lucensis JCM 4490]